MALYGDGSEAAIRAMLRQYLDIYARRTFFLILFSYSFLSCLIINTDLSFKFISVLTRFSLAKSANGRNTHMSCFITYAHTLLHRDVLVFVRLSVMIFVGALLLFVRCCCVHFTSLHSAQNMVLKYISSK